MSGARVASTVIAGLVLTIAAAGSASASPYVLGLDLTVSSASTLNACPFGASADFAEAYDNTEVEPQVAVNPTNPSEITGVSQQDRWPDGGARGLTLLDVRQRRRELVEAARRPVERLPGRARRGSAA